MNRGRRGENVFTTKETIGDVSKSVRAKNPIVHLEIWKGMQKLDPEMWISN